MKKQSRKLSLGELPDHFAEDLLSLELKLDQQPHIATVRKLVDLYSKAVEHYEAQKDPKYSIYHNRLKAMLHREDVIFCLKNPEACPSEDLTFEAVKHQTKLKARKRARALKLGTQSTLPSLRQTEAFVKSQSQTEHNTCLMLQENLKNQEGLLKARITQRKKTSDKEEVTKKVEKVRQVYYSQIQEMSAYAGNPIVDDVIREMERCMYREISQIYSEKPSKTQVLKDVN